MNIKDNSSENEINQKESSSDEQLDPLSASYYINQFQKILLEREEKPDIVIEKILINLFNKFISPDNYECDYYILDNSQKKVKVLCKKYEKYQIIIHLLTKIRSLIKKYREKIFELPNILELKERTFQKYYPRSYSQNKKISDNYIDFGMDRSMIRSRSYPKRKKIFDYYATVKNLFFELKNIKNCLEKTAPIIEQIFEIPLSQYENFSIYECEKEDYWKILINDSFIYNEILKNRNTKLNYLIEEITEDENMNLNEMTNKIEYFKKIQEFKKMKLNELLKISKIGSSLDKRYPEDAKPLSEIQYLIKDYYDNNDNNESISTDINNINCFPSSEEIDIDEYSNIEEQKIENINTINYIEDSSLFNKLKESIISDNNSKEIKKIIEINSGNHINNINTINIKEDNKYIDIPNLLKFNSDNKNNKENINNSINFEKARQDKIRLLKNKERLLKNKEKLLRKKNEIKKENKNENKKIIKDNKKIDKKEIPTDIDDLVKYIINDDKSETQNKKKKKNRKKNKKNKNEAKIEKEEEKINIEEKKRNENDDETKEIKDDFIKNSINRFKIHKIKFKYESNWLEKISNYP